MSAFVRATYRHDAGIRRLLQDSPMPGHIRVCYCREPSFLDSLSVSGTQNQTLVYEHDGVVEAVGCRSTKPVYINGAVTRFGYLGGLRIAPRFRNGIVLSRGYRAMRRLHEQDPVDGYLSTIVECNATARTVLTSGKAGIPHYRDLGRYKVWAVPFGRKTKERRPVCRIADPGTVPLADVVTFLNRQGQARQFFPEYRLEHFGSNYLRGFDTSNFVVALTGSSIAGVLGVWDQNSFRRHRLAGYSDTMTTVRPVLNLALRAAGLGRLPRPGDDIRTLTLFAVCVHGDDIGVLRTMLREVNARHRGQGTHGFMVGMHERDPLCGALKGFARLCYTSRLYVVYWEETSVLRSRSMDDRVPYLELGSL